MLSCLEGTIISISACQFLISVGPQKLERNNGSGSIKTTHG